MPPLILWAVGAVGAFALGRLVARQARRIGAQRHPHPTASRQTEAVTLERDPKTGIYRPK
jgi:hypothetical protein